MSDDLDAARGRFAAAPKSKPGECLESKNLLTATQAGFVHTSLDCVSAQSMPNKVKLMPQCVVAHCVDFKAFQINILKTRERAELVEKVLAYMYSQYTFFLQGNDLVKDLEPYMRTLSAQVCVQPNGPSTSAPDEL